MAIAITTIILTIGTAIIMTIVLFFFFLLPGLRVRVVSASSSLASFPSLFLGTKRTGVYRAGLPRPSDGSRSTI